MIFYQKKNCWSLSKLKNTSLQMNDYLYKSTVDYINSNYTGKFFTEKCYKYIYGIQLCGCCRGELTSKDFVSFHKGYYRFNTVKCRHNEVQLPTPVFTSNIPELTNLELETIINSKRWMNITRGFKDKYPILYSLINKLTFIYRNT